MDNFDLTQPRQKIMDKIRVGWLAWLRPGLSHFIPHWYYNRYLYFMVVMIVAATFCYVSWLGYDSQFYLFSYFNYLDMIAGGPLLLWAVSYYFYLLARRHPSPLSAYWHQFKVSIRYWYVLVLALIDVTVLCLFFSCYTMIKAMITEVQPFYLDVYLYHIEHVLFVGKQAWQWILMWSDSPWLLAGLNFFYNLWFFVVWGSIALFLIMPNSPLRLRFLFNMVLNWFLIGGVTATLLASAGPCFIDRIIPEAHLYTDLMARLQHDDLWLQQQGSWLYLWAVETQDALWQQYVDQSVGFGAGISAMPSMHVSMIVLLALAWQQYHPKLRYLFIPFVVVIYLGSIALAWHYALDGVVSGLLSYLLWQISGRFWPDNRETVPRVLS